jgi:hypothetical protein
MKMIYVTYICCECGADDTDKFFSHERSHLAVNCFKCHSGQGMSPEQMLAAGKGMHPQASRRRAS